MYWKQEYRFTNCGHRYVVEDNSGVVRKCAAAEAYGHACIGSFENKESDLLVEQGNCPGCEYAANQAVSDKKPKRN
jgi:hypothetical protein